MGADFRFTRISLTFLSRSMSYHEKEISSNSTELTENETILFKCSAPNMNPKPHFKLYLGTKEVSFEKIKFWSYREFIYKANLMDFSKKLRCVINHSGCGNSYQSIERAVQLLIK